MRILFLSDFQQDYLSSMIFEGLCELLGDESVYVYPMLKRWKHGVPDDDYILPDGKVGFTSASQSEKVRPMLPETTINDIVDDLDSFDMMIVASPREYAINSFFEIQKQVGVISIPIILMDGEDGPNVQERLIDAINPTVTFKREIMYDAFYKNKKIYPLPFAALVSALPDYDDTNKTLDVFGIFGNTNKLRRRMVKEFHNLYPVSSGLKSIVDIDNGIDESERDWPRCGKIAYQDYTKNIANTKIGLSCIGHGKDCVRYWEIPSYNTLMMCVNPKLQIPFPFKDKVNCIMIKDDLSNFQEMLDYYLTHDEERIKIAKAGHEHLMKFHTCRERARYMLDIIQGAI